MATECIMTTATLPLKQNKSRYSTSATLSRFHTQEADDPKAVSLFKANTYSQQSRQGSKTK